MTYSSGGLIQAADYNGFVDTNVGANINATWGTGVTSAGYGQTAIPCGRYKVLLTLETCL